MENNGGFRVIWVVLQWHLDFAPCRGDSCSLEYTGLGSGAKVQLEIYIWQILVVWGLQGGGPNPRCPSAPQFSPVAQPRQT